MRRYVIVDIDNTVSKVGERLKYFNQKPVNWDKFYGSCQEDEPNTPIIELVQILYLKDYEIIFCTGRPEKIREETKNWLNKNVFVSYSLLMRKNGDHRKDSIIKSELLKEAGIKLEEIFLVLEDRNSVVKMWRDLGLVCLQVVEGNY